MPRTSSKSDKSTRPADRYAEPDGMVPVALGSLVNMSHHMAIMVRRFRVQLEEAGFCSRVLQQRMDELERNNAMVRGRFSATARFASDALAELTRFGEWLQPAWEQNEAMLKELDNIRTRLDFNLRLCEQLQQTTVRLSEIIGQLGSSLLQVDESLAVTDRLTEETSMLAVNATIESGRVGLTGFGFSAIADEVNRLAMKNKETIGQHLQAIAGLRRKLAITLQSLSLCLQQTEEVRQDAEDSLRLFEGIALQFRRIQRLLSDSRGAAGTRFELLAQIRQLSHVMLQSSEQASLCLEIQRNLTGLLSLLMNEAEQTGAGIAEQSIHSSLIIDELDLEGFPESSGGYRAAVPTPVKTVDPVLAMDPVSSEICSQIYSRLVQQDDSGRIVPDLAVAWESEDDGRIWTFHLRRDAVFHDGNRLTSHGVKQALERLVDPGLGSPMARLLAMVEGVSDFISGAAKTVTGMQTPDPETIRFVLVHPYQPFIANLAHTACSIPMIHEKGDSPAFSDGLVGSGPFQPANDVSAQRIMLKPFDAFGQGRAFLNSAEFILEPGVEERLNGVVSGEFHHIRLTGRMVQEAAHNPLTRGNVMRFPGNGSFFAGFNLNRDGPWQDIRFRQAMNYAVDRQYLVEKILCGMGVPAFGPLPSGNLPGLEYPALYGYDPDHATRLLKESGWDGRDKLIVFTADTGLLIELGNFLAESLSRIGVLVELNVLSWTSYQNPFELASCDMFVGGWSGDTNDPDSFLFPLFHSASRGVYPGRFRHDGVDRMLAEARCIASYDARQDLYRRICEVIQHEAPWVFLYHPLSGVLKGGMVKGLRVDLSGEVVLRDIRLDGPSSRKQVECPYSQAHRLGWSYSLQKTLLQRVYQVIAEASEINGAICEGIDQLSKLRNRSLSPAIRLLDEKSGEMIAAGLRIVSAMSDITECMNRTVEHLPVLFRQAELGGSRLETLGASLEMLQHQLKAWCAGAFPVHETVALLAGMSDQTTLLAINANIEAARVGPEFGGFGAVARKIMALSEGAGEAARQIEETSSDITRGSQEAIQEGVSAASRLDQATAGYRDASGLFHRLAENLTEWSARMAEAHPLMAGFDPADMLPDDASGKPGTAPDPIQNDALTERIESLCAQQGMRLEAAKSSCSRLLEHDEGQTGLETAVTNGKMVNLPGRITAGVARLPSDCDPVFARDRLCCQIVGVIFAGLVQLDIGGVIRPAVAQSWEKTPDDRVWKFVLQPEARFHNGSPITSEDVRFSLQRLMDPAIHSPFANLLSGVSGAAAFKDGRATEITGIITPDPHRIEFSLERPDPGFLRRLSHPAASIVPREEIMRLGARFSGEPVGSGPLVILRHQPGQELVLKPFTGSFFQGPPVIGEVHFTIIASARDRFNRLADGQVALAALDPADAANQGALDYAEAQIVFLPPLKRTVALFNPSKHGPLQNPGVRAALQCFIDGEAFATKLGIMFDADLEQPGELTFHPERGRELMSEAGFPDGLPEALNLTIDAVPDGTSRHWLETICALLKEQLETVGLQANILRTGVDDGCPESSGLPGISGNWDLCVAESVRDPWIGTWQMPDSVGSAGRPRADIPPEAETMTFLHLVREREGYLVSENVRGLSVDPAGVLRLERIWLSKPLED